MTVSPFDIAAELGRSTTSPEQEAQWQSWIGRAYREIQREYGTDYATLDTGMVDDVVTMAVAEHVRAWRESNESRVVVAIDDGREERAYSRDAGPFALPDWAWARLAPRRPSAAFSITPHAVRDCGPFDRWDRP